MDISQSELDDLHAQVLAQKFMINAIRIGPVDKKILTNADIEVVIESTLASLDHVQDPTVEAVISHLEHFRIASRP